ncbi:tachykinin peptides receptor 86C [Biomphalaria glabrata]|nr:tachykinin peptides receptor 86C [Biomphalaria glabrata]
MDSELNMNSSTALPTQPEGLAHISYSFMELIIIINHTISGVISFFGIVGNVINIIIFYRQGFKDTVNISLLGLAVSDLLSLITSLWVAICWNPLIYYADLPFVPEDIEYMTGSLPHLLCTRITAWITAFVALERCLCIVIPLHVRTIITPFRTAVYIVSTFIVVAIAQTGLFYSSSLQWVFNIARNRTLMSRVVREGSEEIDSITYLVNLVNPFGSFIIVVLCTAITAIQLRRKSEWRMKITMAPSKRTENEADIMSKEKKVIKLVVIISVIFIFSFLPANVSHIIYCSVSSQLQLVLLYIPYISISFSFIKVLEAFNASISIALYYVMSSKFRNNFHDVLGIKSTFLNGQETLLHN